MPSKFIYIFRSMELKVQPLMSHEHSNLQWTSVHPQDTQYISFLHIVNKHHRPAAGVPEYFPFRKLWFAFCDHKNRINKGKTATDDTILLFELGAIKSYVHFLRADIIRSIKFSIKPHSSALSNSQKRFITWMCMCHAVHVATVISNAQMTQITKLYKFMVRH